MLPHQCRFCGHVNPDGAKYCNECGTQLNLKPCRLCDAINDVAADYCHKCGAALPEPSAPALAPVAAATALPGAVAPPREVDPALSGDPVAIAGDSGEAGAPDAPPSAFRDDHRAEVETRSVSPWAWVTAALAAVGIAAYLAHGPDRVDDAGGPSQAGQSDPARNPAAGGATSASPAPPEATPTATPTATSSSGASHQVPVDPAAPGRSSIPTEVGAETSAVGTGSTASGGAALLPGALPGTQPSAQPAASPAAAQAGKAKAKPKAKPKPQPKPKPKAKPKSPTAK